MRIQVRHEMAADERLTPSALEGIVGKTTTVNWPGGPSKARIVQATVLEDGRAAEIILEVSDDVAKFLAETMAELEIDGLWLAPLPPTPINEQNGKP